MLLTLHKTKIASDLGWTMVQYNDNGSLYPKILPDRIKEQMWPLSRKKIANNFFFLGLLYPVL